MIRFSNFAQHQRNLNIINSTQSRIQDLQTQIGTGRKSQDFAGLERDVNRLLDLEGTHVRVTQYRDNITVVDRRLETMELNMSQMFDVMAEFKTLLINALNASNAQDLNMPGSAQVALDQMTVLLNADFNGRYLFSGSRTDTPPVDQAGLPAAYVIPSADGDALTPNPPFFPNGYFMGDSAKLSARFDDSLVMSYGITADEQPFERALRALDIVRKGVPTDKVMLNHALAVTNQAINDLSNARTRIGTNQVALEQIDRKHNDIWVFAERTFSDLEDVDVASAMTQLNAAQITLEASFAVIVRLSQTTLVNFLN